jgi:hypothetical protein
MGVEPVPDLGRHHELGLPEHCLRLRGPGSGLQDGTEQSENGHDPCQAMHGQIIAKPQ